MKNLFIQHEIIFVTDAGYYQRQLMGITDDPGDPLLSQATKMEKACWNGLINDLVSRIMEHDVFQDPVTLQHTRTTGEILIIELGSNAVTLDISRSIDPVFFLARVNEN
jgi:hypothetical protein